MPQHRHQLQTLTRGQSAAVPHTARDCATVRGVTRGLKKKSSSAMISRRVRWPSHADGRWLMYRVFETSLWRGSVLRAQRTFVGTAQPHSRSCHTPSQQRPSLARQDGVRLRLGGACCFVSSPAPSRSKSSSGKGRSRVNGTRPRQGVVLVCLLLCTDSTMQHTHTNTHTHLHNIF